MRLLFTLMITAAVIAPKAEALEITKKDCRALMAFLSASSNLLADAKDLFQKSNSDILLAHSMLLESVTESNLENINASADKRIEATSNFTNSVNGFGGAVAALTPLINGCREAYGV